MANSNASKEQIRAVYRKRAGRYDLVTPLYNLIGFRINAYRRYLVEALKLHEGSTVVELGCGTGLNFPLLQARVRSSGRIVGVDLSPDMLEKARQRVKEKGWRNVELVLEDAAEYRFPATDVVLTSYAITLVPGYEQAIRNGSKALRRNGRFGVLDFKMPDWPMWLTKLAAKTLVGPYAGTVEMAQTRKPRDAIRRYLHEVLYKELYFGAAYLSVGERRGAEHA